MRYPIPRIAGITRAGRDRAAMVQDTVRAANAAGFTNSYEEILQRNRLMEGPGAVSRKVAEKAARVQAGMKADQRTLSHMDNAITDRQSQIDDLRASYFFDPDGPSRKEVRKGTRAGKKDVKALTAARSQVEKDINARNAAEYGDY